MPDCTRYWFSITAGRMYFWVLLHSSCHGSFIYCHCGFCAGTLSLTICSWMPEDTSSSLILASALGWRSLIVLTFTVISVKPNPPTSVRMTL